MNQAYENSRGHGGLVFFSAVFLLLIYGNSLHSSFVFDDWNVIVHRPELRLTRLTPPAILKTFYMEIDEGSVFYRPISCFTLALNYYVGRYEVTGYHIVNVIIHLLTAYFLFRTLLLLMERDGSGFDARETIFIAGLTTILWAAHPIQTQAVTYVVQRIASLTAMFYIMGLYCYTCFRKQLQKTGPGKSVKWLAASLTFFLCAVLSKENAIIFPLGLLLLEIFFFEGFRTIKKHPVVIIGLVCVLMPALLMAGMTILWGKGPGALLSKYDFLPFTLNQRLLTEPRVLFLYISQLLYPVPDRFSLVHDVPFSCSLFAPWSTFWALSGVVFLTVSGFWIGRRYPLIGFPVVFYFFHHLVESTFLPLALVFEHRNYLPSLFFFLPLAVALVYGFRIYRKRNICVWSALFLFAVSIIFLLGLSTRTRNYDWRSPVAVWASALRVAPGLIKPYLALGNWHMQRRDTNTALEFLEKGVNKRKSTSIFEEADVLSLIATIYYQRSELSLSREAAEKSLNVFLEAGRKVPAVMRKEEVRMALAGNYYFLSRLAFHDNMTEALDYIDKALAVSLFYDTNSERIYLHNIKANYLLRTGKSVPARETLRDGLSRCPENRAAYMMLGSALTASGHCSRGYWFYKYFRSLGGKEDRYGELLDLYMAENRYLAGDIRRGDFHIQDFIRRSNGSELSLVLKRFGQADPERPPFIDREKMKRRFQDNFCRFVGTMG